MRAIIGLGNPGTRYAQTRHNAGFLCLDFFAVERGVAFRPALFNAYFAKGTYNESSFVLLKPTTFMNLSGEAVAVAAEQWELQPSDILVVYDDIYLPPGSLRVRQSGGDGGHNGISSILFHLASDQFPRLRIGVGSPAPDEDQAAYVLEKIPEDDVQPLREAFEKSFELMNGFLNGGVKELLDVNSRLSQSKSKPEDSL